MKILLATSNPHKLGEIRATFDQCEAAPGAPGKRAAAPGAPGERDAATGDVAAMAAGEPIELLSLAELSLDGPEPVEDQPTFEGNAVLKARYYADAADHLCLADDSGLEVDALGGEPGVISARYSGATGGRDVVDPANNRLLLERLGDTPADQRIARFVCVMALCQPGETEPVAVVRGTIEGRILTRDEAGVDARGRGDNGFGYDPLFLVPALGKTTAELSPEHKNRISHRGDASRKMWAKLRAGV